MPLFILQHNWMHKVQIVTTLLDKWTRDKSISGILNNGSPKRGVRLARYATRQYNSSAGNVRHYYYLAVHGKETY
jgi:hypothetical protein